VITVNGKTYTGNSIVIANGNVFVDGNTVEIDEGLKNASRPW